MTARTRLSHIFLTILGASTPIWLIGYPTRFHDAYLLGAAVFLGLLMSFLFFLLLFKQDCTSLDIDMTKGGNPCLSPLTLLSLILALLAILCESHLYPRLFSAFPDNTGVPFTASLLVLSVSTLLFCADYREAPPSFLANNRAGGVLGFSAFLVITASCISVAWDGSRDFFFSAMKSALWLSAGACVGAIILKRPTMPQLKWRPRTPR